MILNSSRLSWLIVPPISVILGKETGLGAGVGMEGTTEVLEAVLSFKVLPDELEEELDEVALGREGTAGVLVLATLGVEGIVGILGIAGFLDVVGVVTLGRVATFFSSSSIIFRYSDSVFGLVYVFFFVEVFFLEV